MRYSIIIPTLNQCDRLLKPCLESVLKYTTVNAPDQSEIIVVANGCTDNTEEYLISLQAVYHNIQVLVTPYPVGYTKAVNWGASFAKGEYLVFLNNDTVLLEQPYNQWLEILNAPFTSSGDPVGVTGPMKVPNDSTRRPFIIFFCVMIDKNVFNMLGGLDDIFSPGYGEDTDFCLRAEKAGYACVQVPENSNKYYEPNKMTGNFPIYHMGNQTFGQKEHQNEQLIIRNNQILLHRYGKLEDEVKKQELDREYKNKFSEMLYGNPPYIKKIIEKYVVPDLTGYEVAESAFNLENAKKCDGYMADSELLWLARQASTHRVIIEVGSWHGKSSRALVDNLAIDGKLICVDHWKGSETERDNNHRSAYAEDGDAAYLEFLENMWDTTGTKMHSIRLSSKNAAKFLRRHGFKANMIFIDAGHTKEEVKADIEAWLPLLAEGGIICGHDAFHVNNPWPGVLEATKEKFGNKVKQAPNTSIWYIDNWDFTTYKGVIVDLSEKPKRPPCVFDCFPFNNELDILERRFETLYNHVDRFIIVEAMETHAGQPKDLVFNNNLDRFAKYLDKVTYGPCVIEKFPEFGGSVTDKSWARERFQRDNIMKGLGDCQDDDIVMISDCDEIPHPQQIDKFKKVLHEHPIANLTMDLYYYNDHIKAKQYWLEAKITTYGKLKELSPCGVRYTKNILCLNPLGKHLSYFGGVDSIIKKIEDTAHQEYNKPEFKDKALIFQRMMKGEDVFGRADVEFQKV